MRCRRCPATRCQGLPELREAVARWVGQRFEAPLDPDSEVIPTLGSKEAIFTARRRAT